MKLIDFDETRVHEIMVPRTDMLMLEAEDTLEEAVNLFIEHGHSRIPVYEENLDNVVGILYVKDTLKCLRDADLNCEVRSLLRRPIFVPETIRTAELLEAMRRDHIHIAIVNIFFLYLVVSFFRSRNCGIDTTDRKSVV